MSDVRDQGWDEAAVSPKDPVTGRLKAQPGPLERPGTEAAEEARDEARGGADERASERGAQRD